MKVLAAPTTIALLAASSMERIQAFTPISSPAVARATAMRPAAPGAVAPISQSSFVASSPIRHRAPTTTTSSTTLAMKGNLVDRFVRVFNANVNKFVSGLEDPEKVIVQAVDDMQVSTRVWRENVFVGLLGAISRCTGLVCNQKASALTPFLALENSFFVFLL